MNQLTITGAMEEHVLRGQISSLISLVRKRFNQGHSYEELHDLIFDLLQPFIPYQRIGVGLIDDSRKTVSLRWMKSKLGSSHLPIGFEAPLKGSSLERLMQANRPRIINDLEKYLSEHPGSKSTSAALADGVRSSLTFPLQFDDKPIGFVFFSSGEPNVYRSHHADLLSEIAEEISLFVRHGQLRQFYERNLNYRQVLRTTIHDLRAPLATIQGFLQLMRAEPWFGGLPPSAEHYSDALTRNVTFMSALIDDLSTIYRNDRVTLEPVIVPLADFLLAFRRSAETLAGQKDILFLMSTESLPPRWWFDPKATNQVLNNLLTNAIKFSEPGTTIRLHVACQSDQLRFRLTDEGQGIPECELPLLFQEFSRTSTRPTAGESSTGLGLAIARRIVELQGGTITAKSKIGSGSTFAFWLPFNDAPTI